MLVRFVGEVHNYTNGSSWYGKYALKGNNLYITAISQDSAPTELISRIYSKQ